MNQLQPKGIGERVIMGIDPGTTIMGYGVLHARGRQPHMTLVMVTHYAEELPTCITLHLYLGVFYKLVFMSICGCLHTLGRLLPLTCIFLFFNQSRCPHRSFVQKRNLLRYRSTIDSS